MRAADKAQEIVLPGGGAAAQRDRPGLAWQAPGLGSASLSVRASDLQYASGSTQLLVTVGGAQLAAWSLTSKAFKMFSATVPVGAGQRVVVSAVQSAGNPAQIRLSGALTFFPDDQSGCQFPYADLAQA